MEEEKISLSEIQAKIEDLGAKWVAASTTVSELTIEEQKKMLGLKPTDEEMKLIKKFNLENAKPTFLKRTFGAPEDIGIQDAIDWRNVNGKNWTTPIKNQGGCGSCVAFGTVATLESLLKIRCYNEPDKDIDLSEAHLLWCGGGSCSGWNMDPACTYLKDNGVPDESCFPYQAKTMSCSNTCSDWKNKIGYTKLKNWSKTKDINTMKKCLVENGPQITGMAVYNDFFSYAGGVYEHVSGDLAGYHCISVVGYNDKESYWICKNSWGPGWGEAGWFRIAYGECGLADVFGMWNMEVESAGGCGYAQYVLVDYSCTSSSRVLWAYAGDKWRYKIITDAELSGLAKVVMEASKVYVCWKENELTFIRSFK